jgi:hypothetical protein
MAFIAGNLIEFDDDSREMSLEEFIATHSLPQRAKVTGGFDDPYNPDNSFSNNDVIEVCRVLCPIVMLAFQHPGTHKEVRISVSTRNTTRFRLAPLTASPTYTPKVFNNVRQVAEAWPMAVEARMDHATTGSRHTMVFKRGDILRVVRLDRRTSDSGASKVVLEFKNLTSLALFALPLDYDSCFVEVPDNSRTFTLAELADIARVPRKLYLCPEDQRMYENNSSQDWIPAIPPDFQGEVLVERPDYLVEVRVLPDTDNETDGEEIYVMERFLVPIECDVTLVACESDYVVMSHKQCRLEELCQKPPNVLPRVAQILRWEEETTILQNNFIRPGDFLVLYRLENIRKLAVQVEQRYFFVPLNHPNKFVSNNSARIFLLRELPPSNQMRFPFQMTFAETPTTDNILPSKATLIVNGVFEEMVVVAAKIACGEHLKAAFRLPLRTCLELRFQSRWRKGTTSSKFSPWDGVTEEVTETVYKTALDTANCAYLLPARIPTSSPPQPQSSTFTSDNGNKPPPLPPRSIHFNPLTAPTVRRSATLPTDRRPLPVLPVLQSASFRLPSPRGEIQRPAGDGAAVGGLSVRPQPPIPGRLHQANEDDDDDDDSDYETIADEDEYYRISGNYASGTPDISIPEDGNVRHFSADQLQQLLCQLNVSSETLRVLHQLKIDGRMFADMSNETLLKYRLHKPIIAYFRDRSRVDVTD